jgi:polar amino acid transport system substrate-binding protein
MAMLTLVPASAARASTLEDILKRGELRIACQSQGVPYSFVDKNGERTGSSVELAKLMAKEMGVKATFVNYDWDGLIPALLSGKADLLVADMTPTLQRATKIAFSTPWLYTGSVVFAKQGGKIKTAKDCSAATIAAILASEGENDAKKNFPQAQIKSFKGGGPLLLDAVAKGQADCGVNDGAAVSNQVINYPEKTFVVFPGQISKEPLSFAVRYDSLDLLTWLNQFLLQVTIDGRLNKNLDYWVNTPAWKKDH